MSHLAPRPTTLTCGIAVIDLFSLTSSFCCYCSSVHCITIAITDCLISTGIISIPASLVRSCFTLVIRCCCFISFSLIFTLSSLGISVRTRQYFFRSQDAHISLPFAPNPHRFTPLHRQFSIQNTHSNMTQKQQFQSGKFDPIWVEDPLNSGNNVGRNAFRIFQVQRAFSDAHRALVASLEWDNSMHEFGNDGDMATSYPLLKCLLQNEDVFLSIDDPIHR